MARAELAAVVQHRPALGLRHRRPGAGPLLRRLRTGELDAVDLGLRAPAAARLLHPVGPRRPRQRRRHHGPLDPRGAHLQVRLGHRHQLLRLRGENEPLSGGGKSSGLMSFLKIGDRAAGRHQVGRHHPARRQDGDLDLDHPDIEEFINWKVVEEQKVAALVAGSQAAAAAPQRDPHGAATRRRRPARTASTRRENPALEGAIREAREGARAREPTSSACIQLAAPGLHARSTSRPTTPTGTATPTSRSRARTPTTRCASPTTS